MRLHPIALAHHLRCRHTLSRPQQEGDDIIRSEQRAWHRRLEFVGRPARSVWVEFGRRVDEAGYAARAAAGRLLLTGILHSAATSRSLRPMRRRAIMATATLPATNSTLWVEDYAHFTVAHANPFDR